MYTHVHVYRKRQQSGTSVHGAILREKDRILNHLEPCPNELIFKRRSKERESQKREASEFKARVSLFFFFFLSREGLLKIVAQNRLSPIPSPTFPHSRIFSRVVGHVSTIKKTLSVGKWDARETASCNNSLGRSGRVVHEEEVTSKVTPLKVNCRNTWCRPPSPCSFHPPSFTRFGWKGLKNIDSPQHSSKSTTKSVNVESTL